MIEEKESHVSVTQLPRQLATVTKSMLNFSIVPRMIRLIPCMQPTGPTYWVRLELELTASFMLPPAPSVLLV